MELGLVKYMIKVIRFIFITKKIKNFFISIYKNPEKLKLIHLPIIYRYRLGLGDEKMIDM